MSPPLSLGTKDPVPDPADLEPGAESSRRRREVYRVIFGHDTRAGRAFDVVLIVAILASVVAIMLESVATIRADHGGLLRALEWIFTIAFTLEYGVRLWCVGNSIRYARSFLGIIDLLAFLPTYVSVIVPGGQVLGVVRILRVLRIFRILKLAQYVGEAGLLLRALRASRYKVTVFVMTVVTIAVIVGSLMYLIEGPDSGFTSIPRGVYWGVVTLTTVGFGDITPRTPVGQALASVVMIMGYGIIAVPTGIVTVELAQASREQEVGRACPACREKGHDRDARHCKWCGSVLGQPS